MNSRTLEQRPERAESIFDLRRRKLERLPPLSASVLVDHNAGIDFVVFWKLVDDRQYREFQQFSWPTSEREIVGDSVLVRRTEEVGSGGVVEMESSIARVWVGGGSIFGTVAGEDRAAVDDAMAAMRAAYPRAVARENEVPISFWSYSPNGPRESNRQITVPSWEMISGNYAGDARDHLDGMMRSFRPSHGGQLVLWQGKPGTGKTWALRALASEWRDWADFHYIVDPEVFFGDRADYMLEVLLSVGSDLDGDAEQRWRLLILEDTGEILAADAKEKTGQALSRLLNVVDGLIGQGLRLLVLVTTNEELKKLHPAVARPGRCAARIEFGELSADEAREWASARDVGVPHERATIAELYGAAEGYYGRTDSAIGFAP